MFVLEALVLTFMTTPLVTTLYPPHLRKRVSATGTPFGNVPDDEGLPALGEKSPISGDRASATRTRFTVVLDKLEHLPGAMALAQLVQPANIIDDDKRNSKLNPQITDKPGRASCSLHSPVPRSRAPVSLSALRLIELSDRTSAVMKSSAAETLLHTDPLLAVLRMYGVLHLQGASVHSALAIVPNEDMAYSVVEHARERGSEMVMLPWMPAVDGFASTEGTDGEVGTPAKSPMSNNPFEALFKSAVGFDRSTSVMHSQFVRSVFAQAKTMDVALFVDQSLPGATFRDNGRQHVFLPFFGGPDDRLALDFVVQLCEKPRVSASVVRIVKKGVETGLSDPPLAMVTSKERTGKGVVLSEEANMLTTASVGFFYSPRSMLMI
jgi:hypothetical protein